MNVKGKINFLESKRALTRMAYNMRFEARMPLFRYQFPKHDHFRINMDLNPYLVHYFSSFAYHKEYCKKEYADKKVRIANSKTFLDNCALAHVNLYGQVLDVQKQKDENALIDYSSKPNLIVTF